MRYLVMLALAFTLGACSQSEKKSTDMKDGKAKAEPTKSKPKKKAAATKTSNDTVTCSGFGVKREIAILKDSNGCKVQYTKDGVMTEIADGSLASDHCQNVASKVQSNLESNGFKCQ